MKNLKIITAICFAIFLIIGIFLALPLFNSGQNAENNISNQQDILEIDLAGFETTKALKSATNLQMGFIWSDNLLALDQQIPVEVESQYKSVKGTDLSNFSDYPSDVVRLRDLIESPESPEYTNWLSMPKYGIEAPVIFASFQDFFESKEGQPDNIVDFSKPIQEDPEDVLKGDYKSVPIQRLLQKGVVHLPFSSFPGEVGHSFIVGHSSNFSVVKSDFNKVFKPIERTSKTGDIFYIYDLEGRKLKFEVFEAIEIDENDISRAYRRFPNKDFPDKDRVVTLQGSILENVGGRMQPTKRWLTRGQLILD